jgi:protein tyrosine phosphatase (PTP) superfamily phosphohydrolase (DUF442 family)
MTTNRNPASGPDRRTLANRSGPRPPGLALLGLALLGLVQSGCKTDGCSSCGFGAAISNGVQNGVQAVGDGFRSVGALFHHKRGCGGGPDCGCDGGVEGGVIVDQGIPIVPGGMMVPPPVSGTIVPAPSIESEPLNLKALPDSPNPTSGTSSGGGGGTGSTAKPSASRLVPSGTTGSNSSTNLGRKTSVARRGTDADQSLAKSSSRPTDPSGSADFLDNITHRAPGLRRYASIAPTIAGGSAPSVEGLDWLKERGYRTLVDLRRSAEVDPNFIDAVSDRGMLYISLPLMANRLDASRLARFDDLISRTENRPLFFCDTDGTRAAMAWYIHQRVVGQEDSQSALAEAEELGLGAAEVKLAEEFLATQKPKAKTAMATVRVAMADPSPPPAEPAPTLKGANDPTPPALPEAPDPPARNPAPAEPPVLDAPSTPMLPGESKPQASNSRNPGFRDPGAWKPVAALVLTGLGVPLAFWSRTMLSEFRQGRRLASLPGAKRRSLEAPAGSDA